MRWPRKRCHFQPLPPSVHHNCKGLMKAAVAALASFALHAGAVLALRAARPAPPRPRTAVEIELARPRPATRELPPPRPATTMREPMTAREPLTARGSTTARGPAAAPAPAGGDTKNVAPAETHSAEKVDLFARAAIGHAAN